MPTWNLGSVATHVLTIVDGVPANISGVMVTIVDQQRVFIEDYTGQTVGSPTITEKYQPALIDLAAAETIRMISLLGNDANTFSLGDLSVNKGGMSDSSLTSTFYRQSGMEKLKSLGTKVTYSKAFG